MKEIASVISDQVLTESDSVSTRCCPICRCCERWDPRRRGYFVVSEPPDGMIWDGETHRYVFV